MNKVVRNILFNISYQILNIIIPIITVPYIARIMTPHEIGIYAYSNSVAGFISVFMLLGISNYGSRTIAMHCGKEKGELSGIFWELYALQICTSCLGIGLFLISVPFSAVEYRAALLAQIFALLSVGVDISWYFTGTGQFQCTVIRSSSVRVLQMAAIFLFVKKQEDLLLYILIMTVGTLVGNMSLWVVALRQISVAAVRVTRVLSHLKPNLLLALPLFASSMYIYIDKIMLGAIASSADLGLYEYAEKIVKIPLSVISAIGAVMIPTVSKLVAENDQQACKKMMWASLRYQSLLASGMCFGMAAIAPELVAVYIGQGYAGCGNLVQVMSVIIVAGTFASILLTQYLIPQKKDLAYGLSIVLGAAVNLVLNGILIPGLGSYGAALGTVGAELAVLAGYLFAVRKELRLKPFFVQWCYALICGLAMFVVVEWVTVPISNNLYSLLIGIAVGVAAFAAAALVLLWFQKDALLRILFRKNTEQS